MDTQAASTSHQYLTFALDQEMFGVAIGKVREVLEYGVVTKVPRMPDFMCGVINLRGNVVPVVDMRLKLGLQQTPTTVDTCIVISEVTVDGEAVVLGALVDSVQEVIDLSVDDIAAPPRIGSRVEARTIRGMGKRDDRFIMILDLDRVFSPADLADVGALGP